MDELYCTEPGSALVRCMVAVLNEKIRTQHENRDEEQASRDVANAKKMINSTDGVFDINDYYHPESDNNDETGWRYMFGWFYTPLHFAICAEEEDLVDALPEWKPEATCSPHFHVERQPWYRRGIAWEGS